jgi:hypothetical protein
MLCPYLFEQFIHGISTSNPGQLNISLLPDNVKKKIYFGSSG